MPLREETERGAAGDRRGGGTFSLNWSRKLFVPSLLKFPTRLLRPLQSPFLPSLFVSLYRFVPEASTPLALFLLSSFVFFDFLKILREELFPLSLLMHLCLLLSSCLPACLSLRLPSFAERVTHRTDILFSLAADCGSFFSLRNQKETSEGRGRTDEGGSGDKENTPSGTGPCRLFGCLGFRERKGEDGGSQLFGWNDSFYLSDTQRTRKRAKKKQMIGEFLGEEKKGRAPAVWLID